MNSAVLYLERAAERWPERSAVEYLEEILSYRELRRRSLTYAAGLTPYAHLPVLVLLPRTPQALCAFYGALYAGTCYVPMDYQEAGSRLLTLLSGFPDSAVVTDGPGRERLLSLGLPGERVLTADTLEEGTPNEAAALARVGSVMDLDPIYIMHTSGSTGTPKGVVVTHRGVIDFTDWVVPAFEMDETSVVGLQSPLHFDASVYDLYSCLACGAKLLMIPEAIFRYPAKVPAYLAECGVTCFFWVPGLMIQIANSGGLEGCSLPALKTVTFVGEIMPNKQLNIWRRALPDKRYINLYGPTEATVASTWYVIDRPFEDDEPLPIGRPCANTRVLVLTEDGRAAEAGEQGELCLLGSGLALGYQGQPELTERVFTQNPLQKNYPELMYRTGDLASWNEEGELLFLGRRDSQVKVGGVRLELGEVETAAGCVPGIRRACALFDGKEIALFLETDQALDKRKFNREFRTFVPAYMLPGKVFALAKLPENKNGKIDRPRLKKEYGL